MELLEEITLTPEFKLVKDNWYRLNSINKKLFIYIPTYDKWFYVFMRKVQSGASYGPVDSIDDRCPFCELWHWYPYPKQPPELCLVDTKCEDTRRRMKELVYGCSFDTRVVLASEDCFRRLWKRAVRIDDYFGKDETERRPDAE